MEISRRVRVFEIAAVLLTGLGKFIFMDWLNWKLPYICVAIIFWMAYIGFRYKANKAILQYWGFSRTDFKPVFMALFPYALLAVAAFFAYGYYKHSLILNWHLIPILILYPIWGTIQQFIIIALLAGNLKDMDGSKIPELAIVIFTASVFGLVHYPHYELIAGTFFLALVYTKIYLWKKNLYVLGLFHGWIGAFFYYFVLHRDSWMEVFGR